MDELTLMTAHCAALFVQNEDRELVCVNDWHRRPAPVYWMGFSHKGIVWRFRMDVAVETRAEIERLIGDESTDPSLRWPKHHDSYCALLHEARATSGPTYRLSAHSARSDHSVRRVSLADAAVLRGSGLEAWIPDIPHQQPMFVSLEDGRAVAVCASVRTTPIADEAGVESLPRSRRRGHATAAVAAWSQAVLGAGKVPLYSTTWDNLASQAVARHLGSVAFGWEYRVG